MFWAKIPKYNLICENVDFNAIYYFKAKSSGNEMLLCLQPKVKEERDSMEEENQQKQTEEEMLG